MDIVMKYAPNEEREHQRFMLDTELADFVFDFVAVDVGEIWFGEGFDTVEHQAGSSLRRSFFATRLFLVVCAFLRQSEIAVSS